MGTRTWCLLILLLCNVALMVRVAAIGSLPTSSKAALASHPASPAARIGYVPVETRGRIPASFHSKKKGEALSLDEAKALVRGRPEVLLEKDVFLSLVDTVDASAYEIRPSDVVADVGCGTGALEFKLLRENVPFKHLYAVDIDLASLDFLRCSLKALDQPSCKHVEPFLSRFDDVGLPGKVDVLIIFSTPIGGIGGKTRPEELRLIQSFRRALRPGGRLHFVFFNSPELPTKEAYAAVRPTYEKAGFRICSERNIKPPGIHLVMTPTSSPSPERY